MALLDMASSISPRGHPLNDFSEIGNAYPLPNDDGEEVDVPVAGNGLVAPRQQKSPEETQRLLQPSTVSSSATDTPEIGHAGSGVINNAMTTDRASKTTFEWCESVEEVCGKLSGAKTLKAFQCRKEARRLIALATKETGRADGRDRLRDAEKIRSESHTEVVQALIRKEADLGTLGVKLDEMNTQANYFMLAAQKTVRSGGEARRLMTEAAEFEEKARVLMLSIIQARMEARNNWSKARTSVLGGGKEQMSLKAAIAKARNLQIGKDLLGKGDQMIAWEMEQKFGSQVGTLVTKGLRSRQQSRHMSMQARNEARSMNVAEEILDVDTLRVEAQRHVLDAITLTGADARMEMWASEEKHRRADAIFSRLEKKCKGSVLNLITKSNHNDEEARMMFRDAQRRVEDSRNRQLVMAVKKQTSPDLSRRVEAMIHEQARVVKILDDQIEKVDKKASKAALREALELSLVSMQMCMASLGAQGEAADSFLDSAKGGREDAVDLFRKAVAKAPKSARAALGESGVQLEQVMLEGISCAQDLSAVSLKSGRRNSTADTAATSRSGSIAGASMGESIAGGSTEPLGRLRGDGGDSGSEASFSGSHQSGSSLNTPKPLGSGARLKEEVRDELKRKTESAVDRRRWSDLEMVKEVEENRKKAAEVVLKGKTVQSPIRSKSARGWGKISNVFKVAKLGGLMSAKRGGQSLDDMLGKNMGSPLNPLWTPSNENDTNNAANSFVTPKFRKAVAPPLPSGVQHDV